MRLKTLTAHEKKLTLLLAGAVVVGLHLILLKVAIGQDRVHRIRLAEVEENLAEARFWILQKEEWDQKAARLEKNFRPLPKENPAPAFQKKLQAAAKSSGLKVEDQGTPTPRPGSKFLMYAHAMRLGGSLSQFLDWLVAVYRPEEGIAVTSLSLKIGPESPSMTGEVVVGQFFRPNNP